MATDRKARGLALTRAVDPLARKIIGVGRPDIPYPIKAKSTVITKSPVAVKVADEWGVAFTGGALSIDAVNVRRPGVPVLKYTDPSANGVFNFDYISHVITAAPSAEGKIEAWVYIPDSAGAAGVDVYVTGDTPGGNPPPAALPTNYLKAVFPNTYFVRDAWTPITIALPSAKYANSTITADTTVGTKNLNVTAVSAGGVQLAVGQGINGPGIPPDTTITASAGGGAGAYTISQNATATATGVNLTTRYNLNLGPITWQVVGNPSRTTVQQVRFGLNFPTAGATGGRYMLFDEVGMGGRSVPLVMFTFDGYVDETVRFAKPIFDKYGFRAAMCVDGNNVAAGLIPLKRLYDSGWDAIMQGIGHPNYALPQNLANLAAHIDSCKDTFTAAGLTGALDWFAWPLGTSNAAARAVAKSKGIKGARESNLPRTVFSSLGSSLDYTMNVGAFDLGQASNQQAMIDTVAEAVLAGDSTCFLGHQAITTGTPGSLQYRTADLDALLAYCSDQQMRGNLRVVTPSEYLRITGVNP